MSKCSYCGKELLAGYVSCNLSICSNCYNKINNNHRERKMVELFNDEIYKLQIEQLKQQLAEKEKEIERLVQIIKEQINKTSNTECDLLII